jgi:hypothetical protein
VKRDEARDVTAKVVGSGALLGSEFLDVGNSKFSNGIVGPKTNDKRTSFQMLNLTSGLINRLIVSELTWKAGEAIKKLKEATLLPLRKGHEVR